jgi:hypothetical protein
VAEDELQFPGGRPAAALGRGQARDGRRRGRAHVGRAQAGRGAGGERARELDEAGADIVLERVGGRV